MTTYLSWLPSLGIGSYFGYFGENNLPHSSDTPIQTTQSENSRMFGFWSDMFAKPTKIEKYSTENLK